MRIIVNADDFGMDDLRNSAVIEAFQRGLCSQTSLIMNTSGSDAAIVLSKKHGFFDKVCLHLNLTVGIPLTERIKQIPDICSEGKFNGKFHHSFIKRFSKKHSDVIMEELEAQVIRFIDCGFPMRHIDSHHWIQLDRKITGVMNDLISKYKFLSIRKGENIKPILDRDIIIKKKTYLHMSAYISRYNADLRRSGIITADYVGKIQNIGKYSVSIWDTATADTVIEFITHPIYKDGVLFDKGVAPLIDMIGPLLNSGHSFITYRDLYRS
jgi:predicted glycoside hydrolase/deacetylase ChbG (UPF0249 family)